MSAKFPRGGGGGGGSRTFFSLKSIGPVVNILEIFYYANRDVHKHTNTG